MLFSVLFYLNRVVGVLFDISGNAAFLSHKRIETMELFVLYLAAQANGILYCPSLLQAVLAFFSTF